MNTVILADKFIRFAANLPTGKPLHTLQQQKPFTVEVWRDGLRYTPAASDKGVATTHDRAAVEWMCHVFSNTQSLSTPPYKEKIEGQPKRIGASYFLALAIKYLASRVDGDH